MHTCMNSFLLKCKKGLYLLRCHYCHICTWLNASWQLMMIIRIQQREARCQYHTFEGHIPCVVKEEKNRKVWQKLSRKLAVTLEFKNQTIIYKYLYPNTSLETVISLGNSINYLGLQWWAADQNHILRVRFIHLTTGTTIIKAMNNFTAWSEV